MLQDLAEELPALTLAVAADYLFPRWSTKGIPRRLDSRFKETTTQFVQMNVSLRIQRATTVDLQPLLHAFD